MDLNPTTAPCLFVSIHTELSMQASHRIKNLLQSHMKTSESKYLGTINKCKATDLSDIN